MRIACHEAVARSVRPGDSPDKLSPCPEISKPVGLQGALRNPGRATHRGLFGVASPRGPITETLADVRVSEKIWVGMFGEVTCSVNKRLL